MMRLIAEDFPALGTTVPWLAAIVSGAGWIITALKQKAEIDKLKVDRDKLKAEAIEAAGAILERKQIARTAHRDACRNVSTAAKELIKLIKNDVAEFGEARDKLCRIITDEVLHAFHDYCEWTKLELTHDSSGMEQFVARVLCPELGRIASWVALCNHDRFVKKHRLNPLKISEQTLYVYSQLCSNMDDKDKGTASQRVNAAIDALLQA